MGELHRLRLDEIDAAEASRELPLDEEGAAAIGADMAAIGQLVPIIVRRPGNAAADKRYTLVDGLQRLRGAALAGIAELDAVVVPPLDADEIMRRRVAANLNRRGGSVLHLALLIGARAEIARRDDPQPEVSRHTRAVNARWARRRNAVQYSPAEKVEAEFANTCGNMPHVSWLRATAAMLGCSRDKVRRHLSIYDGVAGPHRDLVPAMLEHPIGDSFTGLYAISRMKGTDAERREELERRLATSGDEPRKMPEPPPIKTNRFVRNLWSNWERLGVAHRNVICDDLAPKLTRGQRARMRAHFDALDRDAR